jgi:hypothetical protein
MSERLGTMRWLATSALGAIVASFLIGLLGMFTKVLLTGNGVAYFASVAAAILAIGVAGPGCWLTLAIVFRAVAKRTTSTRRPSYATAGLLWGVAQALLAIVLTALQMVPVLASAAYVVSIVTGTVLTAAMIYLPPAPDHFFILLSPVVGGWLAGVIFGRIGRNRRGGGSRQDVSGAGAPSPAV